LPEQEKKGDTMNKYYEAAITMVILCVIAAGTYIFLNGIVDTTPGWGGPVIIRKKGQDLSLLVNDEDMWIAYERNLEIHVFHSENGKKWSSYTSPDNPEGYSLQKDPHWLKRPDGAAWLVWRPTETEKQFWKYCYAQPRDNTFTKPEEIVYLNKMRYSYPSTSDVSVLGIRYPSGAWVSVDATGDSYEYDIDDPEGILPEHISLKEYPTFVLYLDTTGTLWAVGSTSAVTSRDGTTWSDPFPLPTGEDCQFFQRRNGEYVSFYTDAGSVFMVVSPDGVEWSEPLLVITKVNQPANVNAAEDDYGTVWAAFTGGTNIFVTWYTDEQYQKDLLRPDYRAKNAEYACIIVLVLGVSWIFFRRSSYYPSLGMYAEKIRWKGLDLKVRLVLFLLFAGGYFFAFRWFWLPCMKWFTATTVLTVGFMVYLLLAGKKENVLLAVALFLVTLIHWGIALAECMG